MVQESMEIKRRKLKNESDSDEDEDDDDDVSDGTMVKNNNTSHGNTSTMKQNDTAVSFVSGMFCIQYNRAFNSVIIL